MCLQEIREKDIFKSLCVFGSQCFGSLKLNLCSLKFSFSPTSLFVLLDIFPIILFRHVNFKRRVKFLLVKTQRFPIVLLHYKSL